MVAAVLCGDGSPGQVPSGDNRQLCVGREKKEEKGFAGFSNELLGSNGQHLVGLLIS